MSRSALSHTEPSGTSVASFTTFWARPACGAASRPASASVNGHGRRRPRPRGIERVIVSPSSFRFIVSPLSLLLGGGGIGTGIVEEEVGFAFEQRFRLALQHDRGEPRRGILVRVE